jgi:hypothetical protein
MMGSHLDFMAGLRFQAEPALVGMIQDQSIISSISAAFVCVGGPGQAGMPSARASSANRLIWCGARRCGRGSFVGVS